MRTTGILLTVAMVSAGVITALGQGQPTDSKRTPGVQAGQDPNRAAFIAVNCKNPPPPPAARGGGPGGAPGGAARGGGGGGAAQPGQTQEYTVTEIPGVIAGGQKWKVLWEDTGNNGDGIVGMDDGSVLVAQNDKSDVVRIDKNGKASVVYTDTFTGGSLAANSKGQLFIGERALSPAIWLLKPQRKLFANTYKGEPLDCLGAGVLNDMVADSKGGVYMTMGGVYYANPKGEVSGRYGTVGGNGIILSRDEKTLYVTGRVGGAQAAGGPPAGGPPPAGGGAPGPGRGGNNAGLVAFDVQPDGSLTNERQFADACGDGSAIDSQGRIYCTGGGNIVTVVGTDGKVLGTIPAPRNLISVAFGGPDKKTLFAIAIRDVQLMSIPTIAQGYKNRPK